MGKTTAVLFTFATIIVSILSLVISISQSWAGISADPLLSLLLESCQLILTIITCGTWAVSHD